MNITGINMLKLEEMKLPYLDQKEIVKYITIVLVVLIVVLLHNTVFNILGFLMGQFLLLCYELSGLLDKIIFGV